MNADRRAYTVLTMNTLAFTVCFACWMTYGVLVTFLVDNGVFDWDKVQIGWLIGIPVLTGSLARLPVGILTDRYGGRPVYTVLMLLSAIPLWLLSSADSYSAFVLAGLGFGFTGASFAVGIAYTSIWFDRKHQGFALGIFGAGNAGAALTSMGAPVLLRRMTAGEAGLDGWRDLPRLYAAILVLTAIVFWFTTWSRVVEGGQSKTLRDRLAPLREIRVWRFGLYYFFVFGGFVALAQWLLPYYVNVYAMSIGTAGLMAAIFTLPSGVIRALGGWMSDRIGARSVMYGVLGVSALCCALLIVPRMDIHAPGQGIMAPRAGTVGAVDESGVELGGQRFELKPKPETLSAVDEDPAHLIWPRFESWQEAAVESGDQVERRQLLARGVTHVYFQANVWIFTGLVFLLGIMMGVGKAAVYKHIPDYFPADVGVVGGIVGVLGGLGGCICPIAFGYLLQWTGLWTTCWMFLLVLTLACLVWMHLVVRGMLRRDAPHLAHRIEDRRGPGAAAPGATGRPAAAETLAEA